MTGDGELLDKQIFWLSTHHISIQQKQIQIKLISKKNNKLIASSTTFSLSDSDNKFFADHYVD